LFASNTGDVSVFIRFFEKKIYYLNSTEDIKVKVTITNNSLEPFSFLVANNRVFNLDFEVKTPANILLAHSQDFNIARRSFQYVFFKEIILSPDEDYGFVAQLDRFVDFDDEGTFSVQALFYPQMLKEPNSPFLRSNAISLDVRPAVLLAEEQELIEEETGERIERRSLPIDEVVSWTINSRQRNQWERFLLYLDVKNLLLNNPEWAARYERLSEEGRLVLLEDYRRSLRQQAVDQDILFIPTEFEILQSTYTPFEGSVTVLAKFAFRDFIEVKRYTYFLERKDRFWLITNYEVVNLGTE
jgi:hypothetical protein